MSRTILQPGQIEAAANIPPHLHQPSRDLFARRGERLLQLAEGHPMGDYLRLVAGLCRLQQALLDNPPALAPLDPERLRKSREHGMPPLAYDLLVREGAWLPWLDALLAGHPAPANAAVGAALEQLREADEGQRKAWAIALLSGQFDLLPAALVPFLGAALQIAWSHWLLGLEEGAVVETESRTLCPACGSPPMAGMIRQGGKETGLRYLSCSLCACEWHYVRIKCSHCEESKHLAYLSLEHDGQPAEKAVLRAETCPSCQGYLKQFYLEFDRHADALADDLASLALDMRLAEDGYLRRSPNLLLAPGGE
ncbi:TPA: formate dehydrogenase accessory protein FdhE [Pseudomonas aeruginosa]|uniref:formate dehydrogenase accessory protein FdhE n=1 Tax=Pseudomonas aeruginosa TaxID=287 RepID=UPI000BB598CC|nr:formate dehydrogenase accessory protein FdhE [Pseudomonas aeruginosa]PBN35198.1 formate dehydrogenase accessory protein FdhE [Pseudomonas aeruginosa]RUJ26176.1 formate dehydrogenase accessory protein FdhE [Pseudomonas aeruginosa]TEN99583.1 formate dehydrogenase accessory protein FdhE [Pseudomonas aeruginosa]TEO03747.1 formate dehydrogenase accessory protein FdhE [Pseudomonas aeruginosa]TEO08226.1 formate dehydrogenase accessory protein FdhE [Pseudomonas aeruginosa]